MVGIHIFFVFLIKFKNMNIKNYIQIIVVSAVFFFFVAIKDKVEIDNDVMAFITDTFTSPVVNQEQKSNTKNRIFKDGVYKGDVIDAYYGFLEVEATIEEGKISDVSFLQYPYDNNTSENINAQAMPILREEAIAIQDSEVDIVSGASNTSRAFRNSLESALSQAK